MCFFDRWGHKEHRGDHSCDGEQAAEQGLLSHCHGPTEGCAGGGEHLDGGGGPHVYEPHVQAE